MREAKVKETAFKNKEELVDAITDYYNELQTNTNLLEKHYTQWLKENRIIGSMPCEDRRGFLWEHITDLDLVWMDMTEYAEKYDDLTAKYIAQEVDKALQLIDPENWHIKVKYLMDVTSKNSKDLSLALEHLNNALSTLIKIGARIDCYLIKKKKATILTALLNVYRLCRAVKGIEQYLSPKEKKAPQLTPEQRLEEAWKAIE